MLGPLWQSRYQVWAVTERSSLLRVVAYIHLNRVTAGTVEDAARYRWSGHRELMKRVKESLLAADSLFTLLGGTRQEARKAYLRLVRQEKKSPWLGAGLVKAPWQRQAPQVETPSRGVPALGWSSGPTRCTPTAHEFLARGSRLAGVSIEAPASPRRTAELVHARELIAGVAIERGGIQVKASALALGKSRDGVSTWLRGAARRRSEDPAFLRRMEDLHRRPADQVHRPGQG